MIIDVTLPPYNAAGDGVTDDTAAVQAAMTAAVAGDEVYFPANTYLLAGLAFDTKTDIIIRGDGPSSIWRRGGLPSSRWLTIGGDELAPPLNCARIEIADLALDARGCTGLGGLAVYNCDDLWIHDVKLFDSTPNWHDTDSDHFGFVVLLSQNILIEDCTAFDIELVEVDYGTDLIVRRCEITRAAGTAAIGWASVVDGTTALNYLIEDVRIIEPKKSGIAFIHDGGMNGNSVQNVTLRHCTVLMHDERGNYPVVFGTVNGLNGAANVWNGITVEDCVLIATSRGRTGSALATSYFGVPATPFDTFIFQRNILIEHPENASPALLAQKLTGSTILDNVICGSTLVANCVLTTVSNPRSFILPLEDMSSAINLETGRRLLVLTDQRGWLDRLMELASNPSERGNVAIDSPWNATVSMSGQRSILTHLDQAKLFIERGNFQRIIVTIGRNDLAAGVRGDVVGGWILYAILNLRKSGVRNIVLTGVLPTGLKTEQDHANEILSGAIGVENFVSSNILETATGALLPQFDSGDGQTLNTDGNDVFAKAIFMAMTGIQL